MLKDALYDTAPVRVGGELLHSALEGVNDELRGERGMGKRGEEGEIRGEEMRRLRGKRRRGE